MRSQSNWGDALEKPRASTHTRSRSRESLPGLDLFVDETGTDAYDQAEMPKGVGMLRPNHVVDEHCQQFANNSDDGEGSGRYQFTQVEACVGDGDPDGARQQHRTDCRNIPVHPGGVTQGERRQNRHGQRENIVVVHPCPCRHRHCVHHELDEHHLDDYEDEVHGQPCVAFDLESLVHGHVERRTSCNHDEREDPSNGGERAPQGRSFEERYSDRGARPGDYDGLHVH
mmetsp:Transcript_12051/g.34438  ORF Transcript_12051/g.34438 Transcript_12051/m.34438 type:complete len:228 (+) Transcript_12051:84-767(+)